MKAVIFSSGDGIRLRPITCSLPHCMLPIMGKPLIEHTARLLAGYGITDITVMSGYLTEEIRKHFSFYPLENADFSFSDSFISDELFSHEDTILISDSILCDINFEELIAGHIQHDGNATVVVKHSPKIYRYGFFCVDKDGFASEYIPFRDFTGIRSIPFTGIAVIKKGTRTGNCKNFQSFMEALLKKENKVYCLPTQAYIGDLSDFESYNHCCRDFMDKKINLPAFCHEKAPSVWIDEDATVMQGTVLTPPVYIGSGCVISKGARIEAYSQICRNTIIDCYASIKRSTVMESSYVSEKASLRGAVIGNHCSIGEESAAYEGSVIGFGSKIGKHCTIRTSVHIWPDKHIEDESCVFENIMWDNAVFPDFFKSGSVEGIVNRELSPEFVSRLARAVTETLGESIAVSCEGDGAGAMIKNALIAGIQSGGGKAYDMGEQPLPITRSAVRFYSFCGGIALSLYKKDSVLHGAIDIIGPKGASIDDASMEKLRHITNNRSSKKAFAQKIPESEFLFEYKLYYLKQLINSTSKKPLGAKILIYTSSQWAGELLRSAAGDLKCDFDFSMQPDINLFSQEVVSGEYDMGAYCDYKCETLTLVTKDGYVLSEFDYCALTSLIVMKSFPDAIIYLPESVPESITMLARKHNVTVKRTSVSPPHIMNELSKNDKKLFLHQFIYRFDAVGAIIILLDYMYSQGITLTDLIAELPPLNIITATISCPKDRQNKAIDELSQKYASHTPLTENALKLNFQKGWVLVIPDSEHSHIKLISNAASTEYAREIADICLDDIAGE